MPPGSPGAGPAGGPVLRFAGLYGPDLIHTQRAVGYSLRLPRG
jgi:hypothetical protein